MLKRIAGAMCQSKAPFFFGALLTGCATNLCDTEAGDPHCTAMVEPAQLTLTASPSRLSLSQGGAITIKLSGIPRYGTRAVLRSASTELSLGLLDKAEQTLMVSSSDLAGRAPGLAQVVVVQANQPEMTAPLRLFVEPSFRDPAKEYDTKLDENYPLWTGISDGGTIYTLNEYPRFSGSTERQLRIIDYQYANSQVVQKTPLSFGAYRGYQMPDQMPGLGAIIGDQLIAISKNPLDPAKPILTDLCNYKTLLCKQIDPTLIEFKKILSLASDRKGRLVAVQTDTEALVYRGTDASPFSERLTLGSMGRNKGAVAGVGVGDLDGDGQSDLITLHQGPVGVSVYLRASESKMLRYSEDLSTQLQGLLGGVLPTAMTLGDMDGDGLDDVVLALGNTVSLLLNQGNGTFTAAMPITIPTITAIDSVAIGNVDSNTTRSPDIAVSSNKSQRVAVLVNQTPY